MNGVVYVLYINKHIGSHIQRRVIYTSQCLGVAKDLQ